MKILVISDTHGYIDKAVKVIKENNNISMIIHLGDYFRDAQKIAYEFPHIQVEYVHGNCDLMPGNVLAEKLLELEGKKVFITHGHRYSVKWNYEKILKRAQELEADLLLFGHTHIAEIFNNGKCFFLNPGSISDPRGGRRESYAIVDINGDVIEPKLFFA